ncbi:MAG: hypothetical protein KJ077_08345 [Anaerolineae bacterium]|nr:hypothetical protein [Anaerolineae bacterium]
MQILNRVFNWWKGQSVTVKLLSGIFGLVMACCLCSIPVALVAPDKTPTPVPAAQDSTAPTAVPPPASTIAPTDTPAPTAAPAPTDTPVPTDTPLADLSFADIIQNPDEKGWNATQYSTYLDTIKGRQVRGWTGVVLEIDEYTGKPYLSLDVEPGEPKIDIYAYISKDDVLKIGLGQAVTIAGTINDTWPEDNGFYALQIENVTLESLGEIPPTPTSAPTGTPTPDIGNDIMAEVMCKDFVRDNLKSPSSADFGGLFDDRDKAMFLEAEQASQFGVDTSKLRNSGVWVVAGEVDAENSFGAMIRSKYTCILDYDKAGQNWYLLDISIE